MFKVGKIVPRLLREYVLPPGSCLPDLFRCRLKKLRFGHLDSRLSILDSRCQLVVLPANYTLITARLSRLRDKMTQGFRQIKKASQKRSLCACAAEFIFRHHHRLRHHHPHRRHRSRRLRLLRARVDVRL